MDNQLIWADNSIMNTLHIASADLIYMDPPFNSRLDYRVKSQKKGNPIAFSDSWRWEERAQAMWEELHHKGLPTLEATLEHLQAGLGFSATLAYLTILTGQLVSAHRLLKATGSIYLHCSSNYSHYLRLLMEAIFGASNFRNQIIWSYRTGGVSKRHFARKHDVLLFFSKSEDYCFTPPQYRSYQKKRYGYNPRYPEYYDAERKAYYHLAVCRDVWEDIPAIGTANRERTGFPTQKPRALLERILQASTEPGQLVVDPFCGSGTTLVVADALGRKWLGIDRSPDAIRTTQKRLADNGITDFRLVQEEKNP